MIKNARAIALETLIRVIHDGSYSNISLNNNLKRSKLSKVDQNLATKLVYGSIQYKIYLDYQLSDLIKTKITESYLYPLLLMSVYQLVFLNKIPNHSVLDEANKLAKLFGHHHSSGYKIVNGILRSFIRRGSILPNKNNLVDYLSVKESFPIWLVKYLIINWGEKRTENILCSFNKPAKNSIRVSSNCDYTAVFNELKQLGFMPQESKLAKDAIILKYGGIAVTELFKKGKLIIQDEAASLAVDAFCFSDNENVLDACSAPGGKTIQIAEKIDKGQVVALDIHKKKLNLVRQNAQRMGVSQKIVTQAVDARKADQCFLGKHFSKILVDAPCSGLGLLRRKPEIRYTKQKKDIISLSKIQLAILNHVSKLLEKNGELIYSTCTISKQEDEDVVKQFLADHKQFDLVPFKLEKIETTSGMLKIMPDSYESDGFFIAKFKLRG